MDVTAVVVGVNEWGRLTSGAVASILREDPALRLIVVDNGSRMPYPEVEGMTIKRLEHTVCYAAALNVGMRGEDPDWFVLFNNDIVLRKKISTKIAKLDPQKLYGFHLWKPDARKYAFPAPYMPSWCYFLSREAHNAIGEFDEECKPMFFEDADYSVRAVQAGFPLEAFDRKTWGVHHLEDERRLDRNTYARAHEADWKRNRAYIVRKHGL